jgi:hypothetical protein
MCGGTPSGTTFPGSAGMGVSTQPSYGLPSQPTQMQGALGQAQPPAYGPPPAMHGNVLQNPTGMANFPQQAQGVPQFGQMPPGPPMTDPRQAGGFFGAPNGLPQGHPGFGNGYFGRYR